MKNQFFSLYKFTVFNCTTSHFIKTFRMEWKIFVILFICGKSANSMRNEFMEKQFGEFVVNFLYFLKEMFNFLRKLMKLFK